MNKSLKEIYENHHTHGERRDFSIMSDERGTFLRGRIGTNKKVLDIGCRDGVLTKTYCEGNDVLGVDIDGQALAVAEKKLCIKTQQMDLYEDWGFPKNNFDVVVAGEILEHLYYPEKIIKKVAEVLNEDGVFLGSVPNAFSLRNRLRLLCAQKQNTPLHDPTHINHFVRKELVELLKTHFEVVHIIPLGRFAKYDKFWPGMFSFMNLFEARKKR